jgi:hypothetical protein
VTRNWDLPDDGGGAVYIPSVDGPGIYAPNHDAAVELLEIAEANGRRLAARRAARQQDGDDAA